MAHEPWDGGIAVASNAELLEKVGMISPGGGSERSNPLSYPPAFSELASRLFRAVEEPYDLFVVRDLFGDRVLGYQLALIAGKPVAVSYDREGIIVLESGETLERGSRALVVADVHFTAQSIRAVASGLEQAGMSVAGAAILLRVVHEEYPFPVWALEDRGQNAHTSHDL